MSDDEKTQAPKNDPNYFFPTDVHVPGEPKPENEKRGFNEPTPPPTVAEKALQQAAADKKPPSRSHVIGNNLKYGRRRRLGMDWKGSFVYDDLQNLPPIELDEDGFPLRPRAVTRTRRRTFSIAERKVRFVLVWSFTGGNVMLACQEGGITRKVYKEWIRDDKVFVQCLEDAKEDIADRLQLRLAQRVGLMVQPATLKVHDAALFGMLKKYRPGLFDEGDLRKDANEKDAEAHEKSNSAEHTIPRPK